MESVDNGSKNAKAKLTKHQLDALDRAFRTTHTPSIASRQGLAKKLDLSESSVKVHSS